MARVELDEDGHRPQVCKGCNICVEVCPDGALRTVKQTDDVVDALRRNWKLCRALPPFFKILSHFLHRYAFDAVDTADFIRSVKTVTGQDLDWFFDQWLYKPGHPVFNVRSAWDPARRVVTLTVAQVQDFTRRIPVFRVPVSIAVVTAGGRVARTVWVREKEETFEFPAETRPLLVRFDEGNTLIKEVSFPKEPDELLYQLRQDDLIGRMGAATELLRFKDDPPTLDALATFGHTFLRVDQRGQTDQTRILAYTINYAAELPPNAGPEYAVKGIFGGYRGYFSTIPYYLKVQEYGDIEDRDIWEYKLNFTPDQLRRLLTHHARWATRTSITSFSKKTVPTTFSPWWNSQSHPCT